MAENAQPESLVTTEWVSEHGSDPNVRLIEVDVDTSAYEQGHVAGAVAWDWHNQLQQYIRRHSYNYLQHIHNFRHHPLHLGQNCKHPYLYNHRSSD